MGRVRLTSISSIKEEELPQRQKSRRSNSSASTCSRQHHQKDPKLGIEGRKKGAGTSDEEIVGVASKVNSKEIHVEKHKELHTR
jgi:hypothetical protein